MKKLNSFIGLALSLALFSSCEKEQEEPQTPAVTQQQECLLSKVLDQNNNLILEMTYNNDKQLVTYADYGAGNSYAFTYAANKTSSITHSFNKPGVFNQTFELNNNGLVKKVTYTNATSPSHELYWPYEYDANNRLVRVDLYAKSPWGPDDYRATSTYTHTNNNMVKFTDIVFTNSTDTTISTLNYEFDTKVNPFVPFKFLGGAPQFWSANNVTKTTRINYSKTGVVMWQQLENTKVYEYNAQGLPVKVTTKDAGGSVTSIRKYEYICN